MRCTLSRWTEPEECDGGDLFSLSLPMDFPRKERGEADIEDPISTLKLWTNVSQSEWRHCYSSKSKYECERRVNIRPWLRQDCLRMTLCPISLFPWKQRSKTNGEQLSLTPYCVKQKPELGDLWAGTHVSGLMKTIHEAGEEWIVASLSQGCPTHLGSHTWPCIGGG